VEKNTLFFFFDGGFSTCFNRKMVPIHFPVIFLGKWFELGNTYLQFQSISVIVHFLCCWFTGGYRNELSTVSPSTFF